MPYSLSSPVRRLLPVLCTLLWLSAAHAQKIKVEYDKSLDFSKFKTYAIDPVDNASKPMLRLAVQAAVQDDLGKRGLSKVAANPDLYVQMYGSSDADFAVGQSDLYYGSWIPPFDYGYVMWTSAPGPTSAIVVHKGELIVDVIDAKQKRLVWRGIAKGKLSDQRSKLIEQVNTWVEKLFQQYPAAKQ